MINATEKLTSLIIEIFDMRPSTAEKCIAILDDIKAIMENEERRGQKTNDLIRCQYCKYACIDPERESDEIYCSENDFWRWDDWFCGSAKRREDERPNQ